MCLAVPGKIVKIETGEGLMCVGKVDFGGILREANLACVPEANPGDYVLVHVGLALTVVAEEAQIIALSTHTGEGMADWYDWLFGLKPQPQEQCKGEVPSPSSAPNSICA